MAQNDWKNTLMQMICDELKDDFDAWVPRAGISKNGNIYITFILKDLHRFIHNVRENISPLRGYYYSEYLTHNNNKEVLTHQQSNEPTSPKMGSNTMSPSVSGTGPETKRRRKKQGEKK